MILQTNRCTIRPFMPQDIDAFMPQEIDAFMLYRNNMEWMQYQSFKGLSKQEYSKALLGDAALENGAQLAIIRNADNALLGDVYLKLEESVCQLGYTVASIYARQGYAYEVTSALIAMLKQKGITLVQAGVEPANIASIQLLKKLGFQLTEMLEEEQIFSLPIL